MALTVSGDFRTQYSWNVWREDPSRVVHAAVEPRQALLSKTSIVTHQDPHGHCGAAGRSKQAPSVVRRNLPRVQALGQGAQVRSGATPCSPPELDLPERVERRPCSPVPEVLPASARRPWVRPQARWRSEQLSSSVSHQLWTSLVRPTAALGQGPTRPTLSTPVRRQQPRDALGAATCRPIALLMNRACSDRLEPSRPDRQWAATDSKRRRPLRREEPRGRLP
jgi:hypothetical protein